MNCWQSFLYKFKKNKYHCAKCGRLIENGKDGDYFKGRSQCNFYCSLCLRDVKEKYWEEMNDIVEEIGKKIIWPDSKDGPFSWKDIRIDEKGEEVK